jgi:protein tyrosine/serine phosphatase
MAKKRLIIDVEEAVHSRLKAEAAQVGARLGPHCRAILERSLEENSSGPPSVEFDREQISKMSLDTLRKLSSSLFSEKPESWERKSAIVESEITRRFRI